MKKHIGGELVVIQATQDGVPASGHFIIENAHRDMALDWDAIYVGFSGYFGAAGPHVFALAPELLRLLEISVENDGGTSYDGEDDEVGSRSCCGEVSYKPHRADCWVPKARAAIAKAKGDAS